MPTVTDVTENSMKFITALLFGLFSGVTVVVLNSGKVELEMMTRQFSIVTMLGAIFMYLFLEVLRPSK